MYFVLLMVIFVVNFLLPFYIAPLFNCLLICLLIWGIYTLFHFRSRIMIAVSWWKKLQIFWVIILSVTAGTLAVLYYRPEIATGIIANLVVFDFTIGFSVFLVSEEATLQDIVIQDIFELKDTIGEHTMFFQSMLNGQQSSEELTPDSRFEQLAESLRKDMERKTEEIYKSISQGISVELDNKLKQDLQDARQNFIDNLSDQKNEILELDAKLNNLFSNFKDTSSQLSAFVKDELLTQSRNVAELKDKVDDIMNEPGETLDAYREEIKKIKKVIAGMASSNAEIHGNKGEFLRNDQIANRFSVGLLKAKQRICIMSPWMNRSVVNKTFFSLLERALKRDVEVCILYGIGEKQCADSGKEQRSEEIAKELLKKFQMYPRFKLQRINTHGKIFIVDDQAIVGSFNFLSFRGDYDGQDMRNEHAYLVKDKAEIDTMKKTDFDKWFLN